MGPYSELAEVSSSDLARRLEVGELSAVRLAQMSLERIAALDYQGVQSVIEVNMDALEIADRLDRERRRHRVRGPLHGLPVIVKDNIDTGDRMLTTAGSLAMTGAPAPRDAPLVARLRAAGAVLIGKANLSEWANVRSDRSRSGWSGRGRQTRNPHVLDRNPGGSSSGSGAAVAAGFAALAVGTETDGSITSPASANGVVGMKPGLGVVSREGVIPVSTSQDSAGPMARTVEDVALLLSVMAARPIDYRSGLTKGALRKQRLGVLRKPYTGHSEYTDRCYEESLVALVECGAVLVDVELTTADDLRSSGVERTILLHELRVGLNSYLAGRTGLRVRSLTDVIHWNEEHAAEEMPYFRQEFFEESEATTGLRNPAYRAARAKALRLARTDGIDKLLADHRLDALIAPGYAPAWVIDQIDGDHVLGGSSQPSAVAGYPIISVPAGWAVDLPLSLVFYAGSGSEAKLLAFAYAFEQMTQARRPPRFLRTLDLP